MKAMAPFARLGVRSLRGGVSLLASGYVFPGITYTQSGNLTYFDSTGTLQTAAVDTMVRDYDPSTLVLRGYPFWEARTNLCLQSANIGTTWSTSATTTTLDTTTSPDGTVNADSLFDTVANTTHDLTQNITIANATVYTFSIFAKQATLTKCELIATRGGGASFLARGFDLAAGTSSANQSGLPDAGSASSFITPVGNGFYRIGITFTSDGTAGVVRVRLANASGVVSYAGSVQSIALFGGVLEAGSFATPYIATTTGAVTRAAPSCAVTGTNFSNIYNQLGDTVVATIKRSAAISNSVAWCISDGTFNEFIGVYTDGTPNHVYTVNDGGVQQVGMQLLAGAGTANTNYKSAVAFKAATFAGAENGITGTPVASGTMPTPNAVYIGSLNGSSQFLNGWLLNLTIYQSALNASVGGLSS